MKRIIIPGLLLTCIEMYGQKPGLDAFVRLPQVVNYNFEDDHIHYASVVSAGLTLRYKACFVDVGSFVSKNDAVGHYAYFGAALRTKSLSDHTLYIVNGFGEFTYLPGQGESKSLFIHTVGISPVWVWSLEKSSIALAFTFGVAFSDHSTSLNSRIIFNYSLPLLK